MNDSKMKFHETRKLREDGNSILLTLPKEAVERAGLVVGEQVMIASTPGASVSVVPWDEASLRESMGLDSE